jgi:cephalosporin hydroxylase
MGIKERVIKLRGVNGIRRRRWARRGVEIPDEGSPFPARVDPERTPRTIDYVRARYSMHHLESYCGVKLGKLPEDLRIYQHLLWHDRVDTVIEIGTQHGGSAMWFRDALAINARYGRISAFRVISIDIDLELARSTFADIDPDHEGIEILEGDVLDAKLPGRVRQLVPENARCLVSEDSAHTYATTSAALRGFAGFVRPGGFVVIEDGAIDIEELRTSKSWPRGVLPAIRDWLQTPEGKAFETRRDLEFYGVTSNPNGFLQRRADAELV